MKRVCHPDGSARCDRRISFAMTEILRFAQNDIHVLQEPL